MQNATPPSSQANVKEGPAIEPAGPLLDWLNKNVKGADGKRQRIRLPVAVRFEDQYRLAFGDVTVGRSLAAPAPDAIHLTLDDTGLSMPLLPAVTSRCPKDAPGCVMLIEGYWGALVEGGPPDVVMPGEAKKWPFSVLKVHGLIEAGAAEAAHAQLVAP
jgi:hypothetical protein